MPHLPKTLDDNTIPDGIDGLANSITRLLKEIQSDATRLDKAATGERRSLLALLDTKDVTDPAGRDQVLAAQVGAIKKQVETEEAAAKDRATAFAQAADEWASELEALRAGTGFTRQ
jgi:hypothetical protein